MYEGVSDEDKVKWSEVAREYTEGRDSFPGASRTWLSGMMATLVSKTGLDRQGIDAETEVSTPQLVDLPSTMSPASIHIPRQIVESKKQARAEEELEFEKVPKKAKLILEAKKIRLGDVDPQPVEGRRTKKTRILKGDTFSENLGFDTVGYSERFGPCSKYQDIGQLEGSTLVPEVLEVESTSQQNVDATKLSTEVISANEDSKNIDTLPHTNVTSIPIDDDNDSEGSTDSSESVFSLSGIWT